VVRNVHEFSLKPSSFTKWVRPLRLDGEKPAGPMQKLHKAAAV